MFFERASNRNSPPAILLRESSRQDAKVHKRTLANLSKSPPELIEQFQQLYMHILKCHLSQDWQGFEGGFSKNTSV